MGKDSVVMVRFKIKCGGVSPHASKHHLQLPKMHCGGMQQHVSKPLPAALQKITAAAGTRSGQTEHTRTYTTTRLIYGIRYTKMAREIVI